MKEYFTEGRRVAAPSFCRALIALACLLVPGACHRSSESAQGISIQEEITPQPAQVGEATVAVQLADAAKNPVAHAAIMVEADMAHPGMAPVFATANEIAPGSYQAKVTFDMGGDWVVLLHIKLADGSKIEHQMDVRGVRSN